LDNKELNIINMHGATTKKSPTDCLSAAKRGVPHLCLLW